MTGPGRVALYALLTVVGMVSIYALGFHARSQRFDAVGLSLTQSYWMESAQRFRYVERVARGEGIPNPDRRMWAPDGYDPRTDTIVQERFYGGVYRALGLGPDVPVEAFVRVFTRVVYGLGIFALVALSGVLHRSRVAALLACLAYAAILPAVERSTGQVLYREHLAIPLFVFHLYFLAGALSRDRRHEPLAAGVFLLAALLAWKVITFYYLILFGFLALALVQGGSPARIRWLAVSCALPAWGAALLAPVHLHFDRFWGSAAAVLSLAVVAVALVDARRPLSRGVRLAGVAVGTGVLLLLLPDARSYDHAWETVRARLVHLGHKPADPAELSFHARHFWSGNYRSPTLARLVRDFGFPLLAAAPGLVAEGLRVARRRQADGHAMVLYLTLALGSAYLVFRKLQAFPAMLLAVFVGAGWVAARGRWRWPLRGVVLAATAAMVLQTYGVVPSPHRWLGLARTADPAAAVSRVYSGDDLASLVGWIESHTGPDDVLLAEFVLSPYLLVETGRPIALNCFFESPMVERYREYAEVLFADEAAMAAFCRRLEIDWVIHAAHQTLRTDDEMSYRYVAAAGPWDPTWPAARFQFQPEALTRFELAHETAFFRVFRVLADGERPAPPGTARSPLFSRTHATNTFGDPARPGWPDRGDPAAALRERVEVRTALSLARAALDAPPTDASLALAATVLDAPPPGAVDDPDLHRLRARLAAARGDADSRRAHLREAETRAAALADPPAHGANR